MNALLSAADMEELKKLFKKKRLHISAQRIKHLWQLITASETIFPTIIQTAMLIQLLHIYDTTKKKEIILTEELGDSTMPISIALGVLAEDWAGMSNSVLGIVHQKEGNILFVRGLAVDYEDRKVGIIILVFALDTPEKYNRFLIEKTELIDLIRKASRGSADKTVLLEDETIKFEIYNNAINQLKKITPKADLPEIIGENGEALKFFSSRSREYLEERRIQDLAQLILTNYQFQKAIRAGKADKKIKIHNFVTRYEKLTGITFACKEENFSIEEFLKTLDFIVPGCIIKHHKSFVSSEGILVYRIEIVDAFEEPLKPEVVKYIEITLGKLISLNYKERFTPVRSIGGFEHYARAIIPFLMDELIRTQRTQIFISSGKKTEFNIYIKLIIVTLDLGNVNTLIRKLEVVPGIEIYSVNPPKMFKKIIEVNILNLKVSLAEFNSIPAIFTAIKNSLRPLYGNFRDFDEGLREIDLHALNHLLATLTSINPVLIREIFFNFDELYRVETPVPILAEIINLCCHTINQSKRIKPEQTVIAYKNISYPADRPPIKTVLVVSYMKEKKILGKIIKSLKDVETYFTQSEWYNRFYLILILKKYNQALTDAEIKKITGECLPKALKNMVLVQKESDQAADTC